MSGGNDYLSDLPVLELGTLTACLDGLDEYEAAYYTIMGSSYNFADVHNLSNIVEQPVTTFLSPYAVSESMLKADLTSVTGAPVREFSRDRLSMPVPMKSAVLTSHQAVVPWICSA